MSLVLNIYDFLVQSAAKLRILWTKIPSMTIGKNFNKKGGYNGNFISNNLKT